MANLPLGEQSAPLPWSSAETSTAALGEQSAPAPWSAPTQSARVRAADQWARDEVCLEFSQPMRMSQALLTATNYAITPLTAGADPVTIRFVMGDTKVASVSKVWLVVSPPTEGSEYQVTVAESLRSDAGIVLRPEARTCRFVARRTKVDLVFGQPIWSKDPTSQVRGFLEATLRQVEVVMGDRDDSL